MGQPKGIYGWAKFRNVTKNGQLFFNFALALMLLLAHRLKEVDSLTMLTEMTVMVDIHRALLNPDMSRVSRT